MTVHRERTPLPTWRDLPVDDGVPMDNRDHPRQAYEYLLQPLRRFLAEQGLPAYLGQNCFIYYQLEPLRFKGPDFFVVNGGKEAGQGSWVVWDEGGLYPSCVVELLSPTTERADRTSKKDFYQNVFKTADYFIYDTDDQEFSGWRLVDGVYRPVGVLPSGRVQLQSLPLQLGVHGQWLRWYTPDGVLLPTAAERAETAEAAADAAQAGANAAQAAASAAQAAADAARASAEQADSSATAERLRAERAEAAAAIERQRAERLAERLRALGEEA